MSLISLREVSHRYPSTLGDLPVLSRVHLELERDSVLAVVGESGCGKTTLGRVAAGLVRPSSGEVRFEGNDIWASPKREWRRYRRSVQVIHQDPYASLNPGLTVEDALRPGLLRHRVVAKKELRLEITRLLEMVGLSTSSGFLQSYPHELSGGQRQRLVIARAMSLRPKVVVADEAVSMLDVSMRVSVLDLLLSMRSQYQLSYLFISHDFGVVRYFARGERIMVMFFGVVVEQGPSEDVISHPRHPYTYLLLEAVPVPNPRLSRLRLGEANTGIANRVEAAPSAKGCIFSNRCPYAGARCFEESPSLQDVAPGHQAACWFPERVPDLSATAKVGCTDAGASPVGSLG